MKKRSKKRSNDISKKLNSVLFLGNINPYYWEYSGIYLPLLEVFTKVVTYNRKLKKLILGEKAMYDEIINIIEIEKPDYIFVGFSTDELPFDFLKRIKLNFPQTKILTIIGDDDSYFENYSRYLALFVDYIIVGTYPKKYYYDYLTEGLNNAYYLPLTVNCKEFKSLKLKKKYDVIFIGTPKSEKSERYEYLKFLKESGINLKIFGWGWINYSELKSIYGGALKFNEVVNTINESKINLNLSKNDYGINVVKGRFFEIASCNSFSLNEHTSDYLNDFIEDKNIVMFKTKEEMLNKIRLYLKNSKERNKISRNCFKIVQSKFDLSKNIKLFFNNIKSDSDKKFNLPELNKKSILIQEKDLYLDRENLSNKLEGYDFIYFFKNDSISEKYREYLQIYSLLKSNKPISACSYHVYSKVLGNYLYFNIDLSYRRIEKKEFNSLIDLSQLMVKKEFLFQNIELFKSYYKGKKIEVVNTDNTVFISYPLVKIKRKFYIDYISLKKSFEFKFLNKLYSLKYNKNRFLYVYLFYLFLFSLNGNFFLLKILFETLKDKDKKKRLKIIDSFEKS
jgi:hypothetical protein